MADTDQAIATETSTEIPEKDLDQVTGGGFLQLGGVAGESTDDKHKDTIHVGS